MSASTAPETAAETAALTALTREQRATALEAMSGRDGGDDLDVLVLEVDDGVEGFVGHILRQQVC